VEPHYDLCAGRRGNVCRHTRIRGLQLYCPGGKPRCGTGEGRALDNSGARRVGGCGRAAGTRGDAGGYGTARPDRTNRCRGAPVSFAGTWNVATTYAMGAAVFYNGSSYVSLLGVNVGNTPASGAPWSLLAQQGMTGPTGPQGAQGIAGPAGANGLTGSIGPQGPPISFQGIWSNSTTYKAGDAVFFNGSSYISLSAANTNNAPLAGSPWALLAQQGSTGLTGNTGATGSQGIQGIQGVTGYTGPQGIQGIQGIIGLTGAAGPPRMFAAQFPNIGAATSYVGLNGSVTYQLYAPMATTMSSACTFNALYVSATIVGNVAPSIMTFTLYKNGAATSVSSSVSLSVSGVTVTTSDLSHIFSVVTGDTVAIQVAQTGSPAPSVRTGITSECQ
jgi:hypothetical protein